MSAITAIRALATVSAAAALTRAGTSAGKGRPMPSHRRPSRAARLPLALAAALLPTLAVAAGSYDGSWRGASTGTLGAGCTVATVASLRVEGGRATGEDVIPDGSFMPAGRFAIEGAVAADGSFSGRVGDWDARGKFSGDAFSGDYEFGPCTMVMQLRRAP
jgi:hypothetical protein